MASVIANLQYSIVPYLYIYELIDINNLFRIEKCAIKIDRIAKPGRLPKHSNV